MFSDIVDSNVYIEKAIFFDIKNFSIKPYDIFDIKHDIFVYTSFWTFDLDLNPLYFPYFPTITL